MRKILTLVVLLFAYAFTSFAQKWEHVTLPGDELMGNAATPSHYLKKGDCVIMILESDKPSVVLACDGIFNYNSDNKVLSRIGFYDINNNLLDSSTEYLKLSRSESSKAYISEYFAPKVLDYFKNQKGYIRIVADCYGSTTYDIKAPCFNNPKPATKSRGKSKGKKKQ